jgi:hypothetical protein
MAPDPEPFEGLPLDKPLIDEDLWERAGRSLVTAAPSEGEPAD